MDRRVLFPREINHVSQPKNCCQLPTVRRSRKDVANFLVDAGLIYTAETGGKFSTSKYTRFFIRWTAVSFYAGEISSLKKSWGSTKSFLVKGNIGGSNWLNKNISRRIGGFLCYDSGYQSKLLERSIFIKCRYREWFAEKEPMQPKNNNSAHTIKKVHSSNLPSNFPSLLVLIIQLAAQDVGCYKSSGCQFYGPFFIFWGRNKYIKIMMRVTILLEIIELILRNRNQAHWSLPFLFM